MNLVELYTVYKNHPSICTDTRKITPGCLFFALKGDNFDGNEFAGQALEAGAAFVLIDNPQYKKSDNYILVSDVLQTLQKLAKHHRQQLKIPVIGITGTNGKTTTKELVHAVLSQHYKTYATVGNLNNHIGVPLTILSIAADVEMAIIEMGANHQKEIGFLCDIAQPTHGLITNVGKAHLEGFGGFEGVKKAKGELYQYLAENNGIAFINYNNHYLVDMSRMYNLQQIVDYGTGAANLVSGNLKETSPNLVIEWHRERMEFDDRTHVTTSNLAGNYNFENILAAICIGSFFGLSPDEVNSGISSYYPANNRSQITKTESNTLICDYYNANPSSMLVALSNFESITAQNKTMILGDMFELGNEAAEEHKIVLQKALQVKADKRIFIGEEFYQLSVVSYQLSGISSQVSASGTQPTTNKQQPTVFRHKSPSPSERGWGEANNQPTNKFYRTTKEAYEALKSDPIKNSTVLVKGSRGMKLEQLIELL